jgi:hypothetical protein
LPYASGLTLGLINFLTHPPKKGGWPCSFPDPP